MEKQFVPLFVDTLETNLRVDYPFKLNQQDIKETLGFYTLVLSKIKTANDRQQKINQYIETSKNNQVKNAVSWLKTRIHKYILDQVLPHTKSQKQKIQICHIQDELISSLTRLGNGSVKQNISYEKCTIKNAQFQLIDKKLYKKFPNQKAVQTLWMCQKTNDKRYVWRATKLVDKIDVVMLMNFILMKRKQGFQYCPSILINAGSHGGNAGENAYESGSLEYTDPGIFNDMLWVIKTLLDQTQQRINQGFKNAEIRLTYELISTKFFVRKIGVHSCCIYPQTADHIIDVQCLGARNKVNANDLHIGKLYKENDLLFQSQNYLSTIKVKEKRKITNQDSELQLEVNEIEYINCYSDQNFINLMQEGHQFPNLTSFNSYSPDITNKSLKKLANVKLLDIKFRNLQSFEISNSRVTDAGFIMFVEIADNFKNLKQINFLQTYITSQGLISFVKNVGNFSNLQVINFQQNQITDAGLKALAGDAGQLKNLRQITLSKNKITDVGLEALAKAAGQFNNLQLINLSENKITDVGLEALAKAAGQFNNLQSIDLSGTQITDEGLKAMAKVAGQFKNLKSIDLSNNKITDVGLEALAQATGQFNNLQYIYLSETYITDEGLKALAQVAGQFKNLKSINLLGNNITDEGLKAMAKVAGQFKNLKSINLSRNNITDEGLKAMAQLAGQFKNLQQMYFRKNDISDAGLKALAKEAGQLKNLRKIDFSENDISDAGLQALALAASEFKNLHQIYLNNNYITDEGLKALAKAAGQFKNLQTIYLQRNIQITDQGLKALAKVAGQFKNFKKIYVSTAQITYKVVQAIKKEYKIGFSINY